MDWWFSKSIARFSWTKIGLQILLLISSSKTSSFIYISRDSIFFLFFPLFGWPGLRDQSKRPQSLWGISVSIISSNLYIMVKRIYLSPLKSLYLPSVLPLKGPTQDKCWKLFGYRYSRSYRTAYFPCTFEHCKSRASAAGSKW